MWLKAASCLALLLIATACTSPERARYYAAKDLAEFALDLDCNEFPGPGRLPQSIAFRRDPKDYAILREAEDLVRNSGAEFFYGGDLAIALDRDYALSWLAGGYAWIGAFDDAQRITEALEDRSARNDAWAGLATAYGYAGDIAKARELVATLPKGHYLLTVWDTDTVSTYAAAAEARAGNVRAARELLRDLGVEPGQADLRLAPWLVDAGRAEEALTLVRGAAGSERHLRVRAFTAVGEAAFRAGRPEIGRAAVEEAHRLRREAGYEIFNVLMFDLHDSLTLVDLLYQEDETEAARAMAEELTEDLIGLGQADPAQDSMIFEQLLLMFELQRGHRDLEGAEAALKALRRRDSPEPDAAEHWAQVAATRQVWVMMQRGQDKAGLRLAESIKEPVPRCTALANAARGLANQGQFMRAWQLSDVVVREGCLETALALEEDDQHYFASNPYEVIALEAFSRGDSTTACEALGRVETGQARLQTLMQMIRVLAGEGYPEVAAAVARSISDPRFRFHALLEAVHPLPTGLGARLPLRTWWGERLR